MGNQQEEGKGLSSRAAALLVAGARRFLPRQVKEELYRRTGGATAAIADPAAGKAEEMARDNEVMLRQLLGILRWELKVPPPPPKHLQVRVVGGYVPEFLSSGFTTIYPMLRKALLPSGKTPEDFRTILDYGCGCGRGVRALATLLPESRIHGTDIDGEAIAWLKANYSRFGEFAVAPHRPPTAYADGTFDLIFGISVLTHLPEDLQFLWLEELLRITAPGGYVILTTHGEKHYADRSSEVVEIMRTKGFYYSDFGHNYGKSISLPDFYQTAFHSHDYIRREWGRLFEVVEITTRGIDDHQDVVLLHKVER